MKSEAIELPNFGVDRKKMTRPIPAHIRFAAEKESETISKKIKERCADLEAHALASGPLESAHAKRRLRELELLGERLEEATGALYEGRSGIAMNIIESLDNILRRLEMRDLLFDLSEVIRRFEREGEP